MRGAINILIIDGASDTLKSCETLLSLSKVTTVTSCSRDAAIHGFFCCNPDIVLVELATPEATRDTLLAFIRQRYAGANIILLSNEDQWRRQSPDAGEGQFGGDAVLARPFTAQQLDTVIQVVLFSRRGGEPRHEGSMPGAGKTAGARIAALTPRERDVLAGILAGCPSKIIAHKLAISIRTVEAHRANIMQRMGACHVVQLVRDAIEAMDLGQYPTPPSAFAPLLRDIYNLARDEKLDAVKQSAGTPRIAQVKR